MFYDFSNAIYKVAECKECGKVEKLPTALENWFIVNISYCYCAEVCFQIGKKNE